MIFNHPIVVGYVLCFNCRSKKYKITKLDDEGQGTSLDDELPSDISDFLERTELNLPSMTLSQSSTDDSSFNLEVVCDDDTEDCIEV
ncbi:unnamed protein product [Euphydryas editha]|uniref:Uncharacterized protein n=1 Tax=Euphydryas editha TaxID=104508 RepID=A0AAU9TQU6_EUPED|nr:unnamed protein product [Euphydryas editha]